MELDQHILLGARVQPICLPLPNESFPPETSCIVGGRGRMEEKGRLPAVLREVQLDLVEPAKCIYILQQSQTQMCSRALTYQRDVDHEVSQDPRLHRDMGSDDEDHSRESSGTGS
ncbi:hypothetical protein VZT92_025170 [Zoarces viviparus]|uniref:Peptidase S1 domain-containing protein n=1 Tax=Zoarces viviparus TaxID=48416 RepID=A0AAW1E5B6_ZOAVI